MKIRATLWTGSVMLLAAACGGPQEAPEETREVPAAALERTAPAVASVGQPRAAVETETGEATYYADILDRQKTASGEPLDQNELVAAHRRFPFGTVLRVTNVENDRSVQVRVIDRGPFGAPREGVERVIDLSRRAAEQLGFIDQGSAPVQIEVLEYGEGLPAA